MGRAAVAGTAGLPAPSRRRRGEPAAGAGGAKSGEFRHRAFRRAGDQGRLGADLRAARRARARDTAPAGDTVAAGRAPATLRPRVTQCPGEPSFPPPADATALPIPSALNFKYSRPFRLGKPERSKVGNHKAGSSPAAGTKDPKDRK